MPKVQVPKDQIEGFKPLPEGVYEVRLDGFRPKPAKTGSSINLRPEMKIVNDPNFNDQYPGWENLNTGSWYLHDFCHAFGEAMVDDGSGQVSIPGDFIGPEDDCTKWQYVGPLLGKIARVYLKQGVDNNNKPTTLIDHYFCALPGCQEKHSAHLAK